MRLVQGAVAWIYDFLAEDMVVLVGTVVAIALAVLAIHTVGNVAGAILFILVVAVIALSLWRTVRV